MEKVDSTVGYEHAALHWLYEVFENQAMTVELQLVENSEQSETGLEDIICMRIWEKLKILRLLLALI